MLDFYFKYEKLDHSKAKTRYDLTTYTMPVYDELKKDFIYLHSDTRRISTQAGRKPNFLLASNKGHISGIYITDITKPNYAFGDMKNTSDLLILIIGEGVLEIFVALNKKNLYHTVTNLLFDGELDAEMNELRKRAIRNFNNAA